MTYKKKFVWTLTSMMVAMMSVGFISCGSDDEDDVVSPIDTTPATLFVGDTKTVEGNVTASKSENTFVASVKNNLITANHVGNTTVVINNKYNILVSVIPKYMIMTSEPVLDWGITKEELKSRWKLGTLEEKDNILAYHDCGDAALVGYSFKNGKLNSVTIAVPTSKGIKFTNYLTERFFMDPREIKDQYVGIDAYTLKDAKTSIVYDASGGYKVGSATVYLCTYMPAN